LGESGPLWAVHSSRHKWPWGLVTIFHGVGEINFRQTSTLGRQHDGSGSDQEGAEALGGHRRVSRRVLPHGYTQFNAQIPLVHQSYYTNAMGTPDLLHKCHGYTNFTTQLPWVPQFYYTNGMGTPILLHKCHGYTKFTTPMLYYYQQSPIV